MNLISLLSFKEDLRYYFKLGIIDEDTKKQDNKIIKENTSPNHNITLIGFKTSNEEVERLNELESTKRKRIK